MNPTDQQLSLPDFPTADDVLQLTAAQLEEAQELKRLSSAAQQGERDRIDIGRRLTAVRTSWPKSGPLAAG